MEPSTLTGQLSAEEQAQLVQTASMFEKIVATQPNDYQTLETLEETYFKLGQAKEGLRTSRRVAKAYVAGGLISKAILAYEAILQRNPEDTEASQALKELSARMEKAGSGGAAAAPQSAATKVLDVAPLSVAGRAQQKTRIETPLEDPGLLLSKFLANQNVATARQLESLNQELRKNEGNMSGQVPATSLIEMLQERGLARTEDVLEMLLEKFRLPYLPLPQYAVDADTVRLLPRDLCFRHLVAPFDRISRTLLVSAVNPYVRPHFEALGEKLGLRLQWHLNTPLEIKQILQNVYRADLVAAKED